MVPLLAALVFASPAGAQERDWHERYDRAITTTRGGAIAGIGGVVLVGGGAATMLAVGSCEAEDGVCTGPWVGDPLVLAGYALGYAGAFTMSSNGLRGRRALAELGTEVSAAPGALAWIFSLGALTTGVFSLQVARPGENMPPLLAVGREEWLWATGGLLAAAFTAGGVQLWLDTKDGPPAPPPATEQARVQLQAVPWTTGRGVGLAVAGTF